MDFAAIATSTRIFLFTAVFAATAISAAWVLMTRNKASNNQQIAAVIGALATIPAAVAAPVAPDGAFTALALVSFAGLALTLTTIVVVALKEEVVFEPAVVMNQPVPAPAFAPATIAPAPAEFSAPAPSTRVATFDSLTRAGIPAPESDAVHTMVHGASFKPVNRIAFLAEQTGDGTAYRMGEDNHLGRAAGSTVVVDDEEASREHCRVKFENGRFVLYDLGGVNGTYLKRAGRKRKITTPTMLADQDVITIGRTKLAFFEVDR
ncbi:MAG: FHA domain-containing protein [Dehalococcoidia bacterium]